MEWKKENLRGLLLVVCGGIAFYSLLQNLPAVAMAVGWVLGILGPFLLGGAMAFILNVPMRAIERRLFPVRPGKQVKGRRPMALLITLLAVIGVLVLASSVIGPGIAEAVRSLAAQVPAAAERLWAQISRLEQYLPMLESLLADWNMEDWKNITQKAAELLQTWGGGILSSGSMVIGGVVSGVSTFVIALIFSFYILLQKEKLGRQGRQVLYALLPERRADRTLEILRLSSRTFSSFLSGQCLEACILGTLFVVSMTIFRMPYALLVGVLISLTALIPIVGAFIGCGVGALLIAIADPWKALGFIVLFLVLQQVEGNLIYPHVVGSSVGLPSIWVLAAVTLGGSLMGILGMLVFIPLCSVLYALFRDYVKTRLSQRHVPVHKWRAVHPTEKTSRPGRWPGRDVFLHAMGHKGTENGPAGFVCPEAELRVPLDGQQKGMVGAGDGLHQPIRGMGLRRQSGCQQMDALVMVAVDPQLLLPGDVGEHTALRQRHGVEGTVVGGLHHVGQDAGLLGRQVLIQRAAHEGIDELHAPADAKDRLAALAEQGEQRALQRVPPGTGRGAEGLRGLAVQGRVHVVAAGEQQPVAKIEDLPGIVLVRLQRHRQRQRACCPQAVQIAGQHPDALKTVVPKGGHGNDRLFHRRSS